MDEQDTGLIALESTVLTAASLESVPPEEQPPACLVVLFGGDIGKRIALGSHAVVIGRTSTADVLLDMDSVSRTHATITRTSKGFVLRDQGSTNGTFVNEQPVRERALRDGDQIRVGRAMLKFLTSSNVEAQYHEEIYRLMTLDGLTQVYNRRYFQEALDREIARSRRYKHPFALVLLDVDHFKQVNDRFGHQAGDLVLRRVSSLLKSKVRLNDLVARIGGEEFAVIVPEAKRGGARALAEKLRKSVEAELFTHEGQAFMVTVSLGVADFSATIETADGLIKLADERLYKAKRDGRNRVC